MNLCLATATHNFKWVKFIQILFDKMEVVDFEIWLIDVMVYLYRFKSCVFNVVINKKKNKYNLERFQKA